MILSLVTLSVLLSTLPWCASGAQIPQHQYVRYMEPMAAAPGAGQGHNNNLHIAHANIKISHVPIQEHHISAVGGRSDHGTPCLNPMVRQEVVQPPTDMKVGPRSTTAFLSDGRIHPVRTRGFSAHGSTTKATQTEGTHTLVLDKVIHNYGGGLDLASGVYTVSVPGFYALTLSAHLESASNVANGSSVSVFKNDLDLVTRGYFGGQTTGSLSIFGELFLNIGDRLEARIKSNGAHMSKFFFSSRLMVATNVPLPLVCPPKGCADEFSGLCHRDSN